MDKSAQKDIDRHRSMYNRSTIKDWIHDMYRSISPDRKKTIIESRKTDYYDGHGKKRVREADLYKPDLGRNGRIDNSHNINSRQPISRDTEKHHDDFHYDASRPTAYKSHMDHMVEKMLTAGISSDSFHRAYYRYGLKAAEENPKASAYWLLWRQERMIWQKFCV
jgi:hypothetical protein